ncbi:MAG TPA: hypothetical protein VNE58_17810 [Casimicrobiaceae bacterium]|nr:hypothetical protein [Casimicrobiaceae bacterium]
MKRARLLSAALAVASNIVLAQTVVVEPAKQWKVGDEVRYERVKMRSDSNAAKPASGRTHIAIKVIEANASGFLVAWRYGRSASDSPSPAAAEAIEQMQQMIEGLEYVLELKPSGELSALRNWQEVRDKALALVDKVMPPAASATHKHAVAQTKALFATREGVQNVLLREVQLFFMLYGWQLDVGESKSHDELLPNPLGGPPLPAIATVRVTSLDGDMAMLRYTLAFDRAKAGKIIADSLAAVAKRMGKPTDDLAKVASSLEVNDEAELAFDVKSRWPQKLTHERVSRIGDRSRADRLVYERR